MFIVQSVSAAAQIVASCVIGEIAQRLGSMKWCIIALFIISFAGNFLYSCASQVSLSAIIGGRVLCGVASSSGALIFSYITALKKDQTKVFKYIAIYRTAAGMFMAISQLIAIFGSYCDFQIKSFKVGSHNAPTFICSFIMLIIAIIFIPLLLDAEVPKKKVQLSFQIALHKFFTVPRNRLFATLILLWSMFFASFLMSEVVYFMPVFLTKSLRWDTKYQGVAFMVASIFGIIGSATSLKIMEMLLTRKEKRIQVLEIGTTDKEPSLVLEKLKKGYLYTTQVKLTLVSLLIAMLGQAYMIGAFQTFIHDTLPNINIGCFFVAGMSLVMVGYNLMASSIPALFSVYIDPQVKVQLMPIIGAISALGKLIAPIVLEHLYQTKFKISIAVGFGMILSALTFPVILWIIVKRI